MERKHWSERVSATAIAGSLHVLLVLLIGLASPSLHVPPRQEEPPEDVIEVELAPRIYQPPKPEPLKLRPPIQQVRKTLSAPATPARPRPVPQRPLVQPQPQPEPRRDPQPAPAPTVKSEPVPQPVKAPEPVKTPEKEKEKEKEKDREKEKPREIEKAKASPLPQPAPAPAPSPAPPSRPSAPQGMRADVPRPDFSLPPGYGRSSDDTGGGLRGVLRATVGCDHQDFSRLSDAERQRCQNAFLRDAGRGSRVDVIPSGKRDAYDLEAAANARRRMQKEGSTASPIVPCDGPGSNLGGGCLPPEAHTGVKR